jgi:hypothetical protein
VLRRDWAPVVLWGFFRSERLEQGLFVGVISEDWPAWLEVRPSLEITSLVITYILAWERDQDFIKHCLLGLSRHIYHFIVGQMFTFKLDMALSREAPNSSGKNAPFVVSYQLWRPRREIIGWVSWNTQNLAGHTLSMPRLVV